VRGWFGSAQQTPNEESEDPVTQTGTSTLNQPQPETTIILTGSPEERSPSDTSRQGVGDSSSSPKGRQVRFVNSNGDVRYPDDEVSDIYEGGGQTDVNSVQLPSQDNLEIPDAIKFDVGDADFKRSCIGKIKHSLWTHKTYSVLGAAGISLVIGAIVVGVLQYKGVIDVPSMFNTSVSGFNGLSRVVQLSIAFGAGAAAIILAYIVGRPAVKVSKLLLKAFKEKQSTARARNRFVSPTAPKTSLQSRVAHFLRSWLGKSNSDSSGENDEETEEAVFSERT
jgi:hypothetical protein